MDKMITIKPRRVRIGDFQFGTEEKKIIQDIVSSNSISEGKMVEAFSEEFAKFVGTRYCVPLNSGTSALMLSLAALKYHSEFKPTKNRKIITTPLTYVATTNAIVTTGFEPEFVDINLEDFSINAELVREKAEQETHYGLLPVHLMGYPCDMEKLNQTASRHGLVVIEDSAEAHGSEFEGEKTGSLGLAGCFSFFIAHNIQAGEFGCVTTNDTELTHLMRSMKGNGRRCYCYVSEITAGKCPHENDGFNPRYIHDYIGFNFKAMEYQGGIASVQLKKARWIHEQRLKNVKYLNDALGKFSDILQLPLFSKKVSYLGYPLLVNNAQYSRNKTVLALKKEGIECRPIFNSIPTQQPAYAHLKKQYEGKLPNAELVGNNGFYVGCHQYLTEEDLEFMAEAFGKALKNQ